MIAVTHKTDPDLTHREASVSARRDRTETIFRPVTDPDLILDVDRRLQMAMQRTNRWNAGAERIFRYKAEEAIGQPVAMLIPPDRVNEEPGILKRIRHGERIDHYETVRRRKDGALLDISLTVSPIVDGQGRIIGASKIARDISDRKRMEAELCAWQRELESRV